MEIAADAPVPMRALLAGARRKQATLLETARRLVLCESPSDSKSAVDACVALAAAHGATWAPASNSIASATSAISSKPASARAQQNRAPLPNPSSSSAISTPSGRSARSIHALPHPRRPPLGPRHARHEGRRCHGRHRNRTARSKPTCCAAKSSSCSTATKRSAVPFRGPSPKPSPGTAPPSTSSNPRRAWPTKPRAKASATGASTSKASPPTPASTLRKAPTPSVELARIIETVSGWTDLKRGLTVSVGVAAGGTKSNVVPAAAWAEIDVRIPRIADGAPHRAQIRRAPPRAIQRCTLTVTGGINRPPMERSRGTVRLFRKAQPARPRTRLRPSTKPPPAADPTAISPRRSAFPRSTAWARSAKARTRGTSPSSSNISPPAPRCSPACSPADTPFHSPTAA